MSNPASIWIPTDVIHLVIENLIVNTHPMQQILVLHNCAKVCMDWNIICKKIVRKSKIKTLELNSKSFIDLEYDPACSPTNWTVEMWIKKSARVGITDAFYPSFPSISMSILCTVESSIKIEQYCYSGKFGFTLFGKDDFDLYYKFTDSWTHMAISCHRLIFGERSDGRLWTESLLSFYINGKFVTNLEIEGEIKCPLGWIGGEFNGTEKKHGFRGEIMDFKVWNTVRSPEEIDKDLYTVYPRDDNLISYMLFTEGHTFDQVRKKELPTYLVTTIERPLTRLLELSE